jgi:molybdate transport system permease protein
VNDGPDHSRRPPRRPWAPLLGTPLALLLILPLLALIVHVRPANLIHNLAQPATLQAIILSFATSGTTVILSIVLGTALAHCLARRRFAGKTLLEVLIDLPTVLPPAVAGIALLLTFGRGGLLGPVERAFGIEVVFTPIAVVFAQTFVSAPYYIKSATIGLANVPRDLEEAAALDGATSLQIFRNVTVPVAWRALAGGAVLCWARALGEFGATIIFAGNYPGRTQTMPLAIYIGFQIDPDQAIALAVLLLAISFVLLIAIRVSVRRGPLHR